MNSVSEQLAIDFCKVKNGLRLIRKAITFFEPQNRFSASPAMPKIFISYRRDDSEFQSHFICRTLRAQFDAESVFMDVDTIPPGVDFRKHLGDAVSQCDVLLAVIGDRWLNARSEDDQRRLDSPRDFVRIEIEAALSRDIPVVPVLVGRVSMPDECDLPETMSELAYRQAVEVRSGRDFDSDVERMINGIMRLLEARQPIPNGKIATLQDMIEPPIEQHTRKITQAPDLISSEAPSKVMPEPATNLEIIVNSIGMKLALIPAGEFLMGSPESEERTFAREKSQHRVEITEPFFLGVHTVTIAEFEKVTREDLSKLKRHGLSSVTKDWYNAVDFCNTLSELEDLPIYYQKGSIIGGNGYRLPTEAEWEFAYRAWTTSTWNFTNEESERRIYGPGGRLIYPLVYGSVPEWCQDWFVENRERVVRGGESRRKERSADRMGGRPGHRILRYHFRVARTCL